MNERAPDWRRAWREGIAPLLSTAGLTALAGGLETDDAALIQGALSDPRPDVPGAGDWPVEGACAMVYGRWKQFGALTVEEIDEHFRSLLSDADAALFARPGCVLAAFFINWFDETPRAAMRRELLAEVRRALDLRTLGEAL